jgi:hypothetical protein
MTPPETFVTQEMVDRARHAIVWQHSARNTPPDDVIRTALEAMRPEPVFTREEVCELMCAAKDEKQSLNPRALWTANEKLKAMRDTMTPPDSYFPLTHLSIHKPAYKQAIGCRSLAQPDAS